MSSEDPAQDGLNWYFYCGGNPIGAIDPLGLSSTDDNEDEERRRKEEEERKRREEEERRKEKDKKEKELAKAEKEKLLKKLMDRLREEANKFKDNNEELNKFLDQYEKDLEKELFTKDIPVVSGIEKMIRNMLNGDPMEKYMNEKGIAYGKGTVPMMGKDPTGLAKLLKSGSILPTLAGGFAGGASSTLFSEANDEPLGDAIINFLIGFSGGAITGYFSTKSGPGSNIAIGGAVSLSSSYLSQKLTGDGEVDVRKVLFDGGVGGAAAGLAGVGMQKTAAANGVPEKLAEVFGKITSFLVGVGTTATSGSIFDK